jgi:hypothetical protein
MVGGIISVANMLLETVVGLFSKKAVHLAINTVSVSSECVTNTVLLLSKNVVFLGGWEVLEQWMYVVGMMTLISERGQGFHVVLVVLSSSRKVHFIKLAVRMNCGQVLMNHYSVVGSVLDLVVIGSCG